MIRVSRKRRLTAVAAATFAAALALSACGGSDSESDESTSSSSPVTVESAYGPVTLDKDPERILVMSPSYVDMLTAIDVQPVAFATGAIPAADFDSNYPWLEGKYEGKVAPELVTAEFKPNLETIASFEPDLILAHTWTIPEEMYAEVSQIAPTYISTDDGSATTEWSADMKAVGELTRETEAVDAALADFDNQVAQNKERVAGLEGKTYNSVAVREAGYQFGSGGWLALLGLVPGATQGGYTDAPLSPENLDQLSADVLLAYVFNDADQTKLEGDGRFADLPASKNGTVIFGDPAMANAATFPAPGALSYLMQETVPALEASALNKAGQ
jgi:iron complex transport system substrate-binding protein